MSDTPIADSPTTPPGAGAPDVSVAPVRGGGFHLAVIALATIACYANSFAGVYLFDDETGIIDNTSIRSLAPWRLLAPPAETTVAGRPIVNATFGLNYAISGLDTWSYHALNLLIHIGAAWALFGVIRRTLRLPKLADRFGRHADALALVIALAWALHPLQTESVTYIVQRAESLAGLIYLASLYAFIRMLTTAPEIRWGWITIALCAVGMLSKEILATAPFILLAYDAILVSDCHFIEAIKRRRRWYAPIFATIVIAVWIFLVNPRGGSAGFGNEDLPTPLEYAGTQPEIILHYLKLTFWPAQLCLDYDWGVETDMASIAIPATILIAALLLVLYGAIRRRPAAFLGVWFFVILAPTSSFVPIADLAFEHRMYLPLAAIIAFVTLMAYQFLGRPAATTSDNSGAMKIVVAGGVVVCVALGARAFERNRDYASALDMWKSVIELRPDNPRAHFNLAHSVYKLGDIRGAIAGYRDAIAIAPNYANALSQLGALLSRIGEHEEALPLLERAAIQKPKEAAIQYNLGITLSSLGRDDEAAKAYRTCLSLDPKRGDAFYNLGNIALRRQDFDAAAKEFENAIRVQPDHIRANYNLGGIFQIRGDTRRAGDHFDRAYAAAMAEGANQRSKGRLVEAVDALQLATQIRPDSAEAHCELARGLKDIGNLDAALREARTAAKLAPAMRSVAELLAELGRPAVNGATP